MGWGPLGSLFGTHADGTITAKCCFQVGTETLYLGNSSLFSFIFLKVPGKCSFHKVQRVCGNRARH